MSPNLSGGRLLWVFIVLHVFLYPASNGFNSYFDKDKGPIGGLKNPPSVHGSLYYLSLLFDVIAIVLAYFKLNATFALMVFIYGLASKAYSHPFIRLKQFPVAGWLVTVFFQGFFTVIMCYTGLNNFNIEIALRPHILTPALLASMMLMGNYPMTQVYQHQEDRDRGDITLSLRLGIQGTFYFASVLFALATAGFFYFYAHYYNLVYATQFIASMVPVVLFFSFWFFRVFKDESKANYNNTMWLNVIAATCLNGFFIWFFLDSSQVMQAINSGY